MKYSEDAMNLTDFKYDGGIPELYLDERKSMRSLMTVSIDPPSCRDDDDALSVKPVMPGEMAMGLMYGNNNNFGSYLETYAPNQIRFVYYFYVFTVAPYIYIYMSMSPNFLPMKISIL